MKTQDDQGAFLGLEEIQPCSVAAGSSHAHPHIPFQVISRAMLLTSPSMAVAQPRGAQLALFHALVQDMDSLPPLCPYRLMENICAAV